jgi:Leu/Phe-tRNA-protein transferase
MNGFRKIFPIFLSRYATFFAKVAERGVVPFDEFCYQLKLMHLFQKHPVCTYIVVTVVSLLSIRLSSRLKITLNKNINSKYVEYAKFNKYIDKCTFDDKFVMLF